MRSNLNHETKFITKSKYATLFLSFISFYWHFFPHHHSYAYFITLKWRPFRLKDILKHLGPHSSSCSCSFLIKMNFLFDNPNMGFCKTYHAVSYNDANHVKWRAIDQHPTAGNLKQSSCTLSNLHKSSQAALTEKMFHFPEGNLSPNSAI